MHQPASSLFLASLASAVSLVAACGGGDDPPAPAELRSRLSADLGHVLTESTAALESGQAAIPSTAAISMLERMLPAEGPLSSARVRTELARIAPEDPIDPEADPLDSDAAVAWLNEHLFTDANHLGNGIYQVPPELVCMTSTYDETTGEESEVLDPECAANLAEAQLRIRVASDDETLTFAVQLGADHDEPLLIGLSHTKVSLTVDLDEAMAAAAALAPVFGEELPNIDLGGQVTGALEVLGTAHAKASVTIDRAIRVRFAEAGIALDGPDAFRFATAASNLVAIEFDGAAEAGSVSVALGETALYEPDEQSALDLPGVTAVAMLAANQPLQITHIGLGGRTTTLTKAGALAMSIDLNPDDGRALGATLTGDAATGVGTLTVSPKLDLRTTVDHAVLGDERQVYDVTRVYLDGAIRGSDTSDAIQIMSGTFAITTDPATYGFSASTGQCVSGTEAYDEPSGYYYTQWAAGTCL